MAPGQLRYGSQVALQRNRMANLRHILRGGLGNGFFHQTLPHPNAHIAQHQFDGILCLQRRQGAQQIDQLRKAGALQARGRHAGKAKGNLIDGNPWVGQRKWL